ncbi:MAG: CDP-alcohol phosphatidyltransferase family protein [Paracoccaceae bacterium]
MLDRFILPVQKTLLAPVARAGLRLGITADQITIAGFLLGVLAVPALAFGHAGIGLLLILANRIADGLDGAMARIAGPTDRGAFLDISFDFLFYALVPLGFALADPGRNAIPAAVLITSFVGTGSSFLAFGVIAEKRGLSAEAYPTKGFFYLGGLTEGTETILFFFAMCLWPSIFWLLAWIFAGLCMLTVLTRWSAGWRAFAPNDTWSS